jgi:hypothetical protein
MTRKFLAALVGTVIGVTGLSVGAAAAVGPDQAVIEATSAFVCEGDANLPANHCANVRSRGNTGLILVFSPDPRGPQESFSFDPRADSRPCPHDPDADPDGTWWQVPDGPYVCHHKP